ncbi:ribonuclease H-like domain-containing protein, partial [candidate division KSB1 bacterium]|nr:ribonuclease H-like domain-containing protein [candidate division KSB1 bacterium]
WVCDRPQVIQDLCKKYPLDKLYRLKTTGQKVMIASYFENGTVRVDISGEYNLIDFDYQVLKPYFQFDLSKVPTLDLLKSVEKILGHRIKLDSIAEATLDANKTASGLDAIKFWKTGQFDKLRAYCVADVKITRDLYDYAVKNERLFYKDFLSLRLIGLYQLRSSQY